MAKRSFFSRLMGNDIVDEGQGESNVANVSSYQEETAMEYQEQENPFLVNGEEDLEDTIGMEQEWSPEYEGQLMVDVFQTKDDVVIQSIVAGVTPDDIDITIANDKVTIEGERKKRVDVPMEDYFYQECYWGSFSRSVVLPVDVDADQVEAKIKDGILTVILPKAEKAKVRKVTVKKGSE